LIYNTIVVRHNRRTMPHHATLYVTKAPHEKRVELKALYGAEAEILDQEFTTVSIGDVRAMIIQSYQTPGDKSFRLMLISAQSIAPEAQQALLKILEEPPATTQFALLLPDLSSVLPTILSRVQVVTNNTVVETTAAFSTFLAQSVPDRITFISEVAKKKDDEVYTELYSGLVAYTADSSRHWPLPVVRTIAEALRTLRLRGSSKKMIWEELALTLPVVQS